MSKESKKRTRFYSMKLVSYCIDVTKFERLFDECVHYVYILHDKDDADPHYHILCTFLQQKSFATVRRLIESEDNTFTQPLFDFVGDFDYLTHANAPDKYQYSDESLVSNDLEFWRRRANYENETVAEDSFVADLLDGLLTYREMAHKYGRDYIRNFRNYQYFAQAVRSEEAWKVQVEARAKAEAEGFVNVPCDLKTVPFDI